MKQNMKDFFTQSKYHMADITRKSPSFRRAIAMGQIEVGKIGFKHINEKTLPKGDILNLAEIAGVQGAKNAWQQIPLCHPLLLDHIAVFLELDKDINSIFAYSIVATTAKTGVEMEALAAVNAALLTIYDLTKPVEPALTIKNIRLLIKEGGKKGLWVHPDGIPKKLQQFLPSKPKQPLKGIKSAIITLSDRAYNKQYEDKSGKILNENLHFLGAKIIDYSILPDEKNLLKEKIFELTKKKVDLIITTGGTGLAKRDITPQTITELEHIAVDGIGELLRSSSASFVPNSWLSRSMAAIIGNSLIICLPGSSGAVKDGIEILKPILPHALAHIRGDKNLHNEAKNGEENDCL